jgi:MFS family permease
MKKVSQDNHNKDNRWIRQTRGNGRRISISKFLSGFLRLSSTKTSSSLHSSSDVMSTSESVSAYAWRTLIVLSCIAVMVMYAETMLIPAIPDLIRDFHVSYSMSSWILTAYLISGAVMTPIAGKLSDIYGKKKMLLIIMVTYGLGVSAAGFSNDIIFMLVARAIQGIGLSMFPIAFSIVREQFPRQKIAIGQGIISSMFAAGSSIGLYIGGTIVQHFSWHATFFTIIPIWAILLFTIWQFINIKRGNENADISNQIQQIQQKQHQGEQQYQQKQQRQKKVMRKEEVGEGARRTSNGNHYSIDDESNPPSSRSMTQIDFKGAISLAAAIIAFLLILTYSQSDKGVDNFTNSTANINIYNNNVNNTANSSTISLLELLILLGIGIISIVTFIIIERRSQNPLIDLKLLLNKAILPANLIVMIFGICMFSIFQTIPILTRAPEPIGFGGNAISAGNVQLPFALILLIFGSTSGLLISKFGSIKPIIAGSVIMIAGFSILSLSHSSEIRVSVYLAIVSAGMSLINVGSMNVVTLATPMKSIGISLGMNMLIRIIGSSIGPAIAGMYMQIYQSKIDIHGIIQQFPSTISFDLIFISSTMLSIASLVLALILRNRIVKMRIPNLR